MDKPMTHPIRVLIVDDHHVVREGLSSFLNAVDDLELVAMAENGAQAIEQVAATLPDVVLMDVIMPQMNGIDAMKHILSTHPQVKVIMLTSFGDEEHIQNAIEYGASGYLLKDATIQDMAAAIRSAVAGGVS
jgi:DNA-binding NarL/FixJ family response regulator